MSALRYGDESSSAESAPPPSGKAPSQADGSGVPHELADGGGPPGLETSGCPVLPEDQEDHEPEKWVGRVKVQDQGDDQKLEDVASHRRGLEYVSHLLLRGE